MGIAVVAILVLGALIIAYFSWQTWRIYQVILVVLIYFATLGFLYLAARTLKTHRNWQTLAEKLEKEVASKQRENEVLQRGDADQPGIAQLKRQLDELSRKRGRVWYGVTPAKVNDDGTASVSVPAPQPHLLAAKDVVFAFDEKSLKEGGRYLGEFQVIKADDKSLEIAPNLSLTAEQIDRLKKSQGPWVLYAVMPMDDPAALAGLNEQQLDEHLPKLSKEELATLLDTKRTPRDFVKFFHDNHDRRRELAVTIGQIKSDIDVTAAAQKKVLADTQARTTEKENLQFDLGHFQQELKLVTDYASDLATRLMAQRQALERIFLAIHQFAADLTVTQLKAVDEINRRTGPALPSAVGAPESGRP